MTRVLQHISNCLSLLPVTTCVIFLMNVHNKHTLCFSVNKITIRAAICVRLDLLHDINFKGTCVKSVSEYLCVVI